MTERITSVVKGDNARLLKVAVAPLWIKHDDRVLDLTFGLGKWWSGYKPINFVGYRGNFTTVRKFSWEFDVVVYDPPYVSVGGRDTHGATGREMNRRYGMDMSAMSPLENQKMIDKGFGKGWRALKEGGLLMVKCSDYISSGRFVQGHRHVLDMARNRGMEQVDEFIHFSGSGPQPLEGRTQTHSHRAHSFLCIFKKVL